MTPIAKWLKGLWERHIGTWEEGPQPPRRIRATVEVFVRAHPQATVGEWLEFATQHAEGSYQEGYVRGFERGERLGPDWQDPDEGAAILEQLDDLRVNGQDPADMSQVVPVEGVPKEQAAKVAIEMSRLYGEQTGMRAGPVPRRR